MRLKTAAVFCETVPEKGKKRLVACEALQPVGAETHSQGSNPGSPVYTVGFDKQGCLTLFILGFVTCK